MRELSGVMVTFCIFMYIGTTQVYVSVRIYQMIHLQFVHFVVSFASNKGKRSSEKMKCSS